MGKADELEAPCVGEPDWAGEETYPAARSFRDLVVWQKAHAFVLHVYRLTEAFPRSEMFGLSSQLRRAVVSIPANIAEAFRKSTSKETARLLNIAQASLEEVRYYGILGHDLGYLSDASFEPSVGEIARLLHAYRKKIVLRMGRSHPDS